jgi:hypothetical protein
MVLPTTTMVDVMSLGGRGLVCKVKLVNDLMVMLYMPYDPKDINELFYNSDGKYTDHQWAAIPEMTITSTMRLDGLISNCGIAGQQHEGFLSAFRKPEPNTQQQQPNSHHHHDTATTPMICSSQLVVKYDYDTDPSRGGPSAERRDLDLNDRAVVAKFDRTLSFVVTAYDRYVIAAGVYNGK